MKKQIGLIGLGKMGGGLALNLHDHGWDVVAFNRTTETTDEYAKQGITPSYSVQELVSALEGPRVVWVMLTAGEPTQNMLFGETGLINYLQEGDILIGKAMNSCKFSAPIASLCAGRAGGFRY